MKKITTLNYNIIPKNQFAYKFLKATSINFPGSTTIFYFIFNFFFKYSFEFEINGHRKIWPIESVSDLRLLRGEYIAENNKYSLETGYEGIDLLYIKTLIKNDDVIIDIGSNKGFYSLFFSSFIGEHGKIYSFEASMQNYKIFFNRLISLWNLKNCLPFNYVLSDSDEQQVSLNKPSILDDGTGFYFSRFSRKKNAVYSRKIDTLLSHCNSIKIKLIKIDVEGAEFVVLNGAINILKNTQMILVEVSNTGVERFGTSAKDLYNLLYNNGFLNAYSIVKSDNNIVSIVNAEKEKVGNVLFSKNKL